jgi:hypothetical protein
MRANLATEAVRQNYSPDQLWTRSGKPICRSLFPRAFAWPESIYDFVKEYRETEASHGYVVNSGTGELVAELLTRLTCRLLMMKKITSNQKDLMVTSLKSGADFPNWDGDEAQAIFVRALFEIGRKRLEMRRLPMTPLEFLHYVCPVELLVSVPISAAIRTQDTLDYRLMSPSLLVSRDIALTNPYLQAGDNLTKRLQALPEYHMAKAYQWGLKTYLDSIKKLSCEYSMIDRAYDILNAKRAELSGEDLEFLGTYERIADFF